MLSRERRELRGGPPGARGDARSAGGPGADRDADPPWAPRDRALRTLDPADRGHSNVGGPRHSAGSSVHRAAPRVRVGSAPRRPGDPRLADGGVRLRRARRYARPVGPALARSVGGHDHGWSRRGRQRARLVRALRRALAVARPAVRHRIRRDGPARLEQRADPDHRRGRPARGRDGPLHDGVRRSRPGRHAAGGDARGEPRHRAHGAAGRAWLPRGIARVRPPVPRTPSVGVSAVRAPAWPARSSSGGSLSRGSASPGLGGGGRRGPLRLVGYAFCWIAVSTRSAVSGALRTRAPVAAKIAFDSAGRIVVVPGSPRPVGYSVDGTTCTSTSGTSLILNTW